TYHSKNINLILKICSTNKTKLFTYTTLFRSYLQEKLNLMNTYRQERIAKMVKRLNDLGYEISLNRVYEISGQGAIGRPHVAKARSEEHTSELQSRENLVCRLLLEKKKKLRIN